jgi:sugar lactone lactonase YvrE
MNRNLWTVSIGIMLLAWSLNGYATDAVTVTTIAGSAGSSGSTDGTGSAARFNYPHGVAVDSSGNVYVADYWNHTIRKVTSAGVVTTLAGLAGNAGSADGTGSAARFDSPYGVAVDSSGNVYVADYGNSTIRKVTSAGVVTTLAGLAYNVGSTDGTGSAARFNYPRGVAVDSSGNVYVADYWNHTIRKVTSAGVVTTLAGLAGSSGSADGTGSAARFNGPSGVAVDSSTNVYVADQGNHTIRKITFIPPSPGTLQFSASSASVSENTGSVTMTVTRSGGSSGAASVNYATANGTASAGTDYTAISDQFTWADGNSDSKTITVLISNRSGTQGSRTFTVTLSSASGASLGSTYQATVTINDVSSGSAGTLQFSTSSASVNENAGSVRLSVTRLGGSSGAATVNYATADGTAVAGSDYTAKSGTLSWSDGQSDTKTKTINVNTISGGSKRFYVNLSSVSGATLGSPFQSTVTIEDNAVLSGTIKSLSGYNQFYVGNSIIFKCVPAGSESGLTCTWDFSGNNQFTDASGLQASYAFSSEGTHKVKARLSDGVNQYTAEYLAAIGKAPVPDEPTAPPPAPDPATGSDAGSAQNPLDSDVMFTADSTKKNVGLIIIVHGLGRDSSDDWVWKMAIAISNRLVSIGKPCPNIMAWDWKKIAKAYIPNINIDLSNWHSILDIIRGPAQNQGQQLAVWIDQNVTANNINPNKPIHIIGHSAGGWVAGGCVNEINRKIDQITTLDTPIYSAGIVERYLKAGNGRRVDMYMTQWGMFSNIYLSPVFKLSGKPNPYYQIRYDDSLYWYEVTDDVDAHDTHGGIPYWYFVNTIAGLEQNGFWYSPWLYPSSSPLPIKMTQKNDIVAAGYQVAKQAVSDFQTFGSVSVADSIYTITEGTGNAGIYTSTAFSSDAKAVMFEYKFTQAGDGDFLSVHVGTNEAAFIGEENDLSRQSFVLGEGDLSAVTGTTAMLTFKLVSRGQPNAQVQIRSIEVLTETEVVGPLITANGLVADAYLNSGDTVTIAVQMNASTYVGTPVDWWVVAFAHSSGWYYLNSAIQWTSFNGDLAFCQPVYQGPLFNLSSTPVLNGFTLSPGTYDFWFAVDYPMDGILNLSGPILYNKVTVVVQ